MARIVESVQIAVSPKIAWESVGDIGGLAKSVPQLVAKCEYDPDTRIRTVEFTNGMVLIEPIIAHCDERRELVWTARGGSWDHHNASLSVLGDGFGTDSCIVEWIADVLPDSEEDTIRAIVKAGLSALKETLESDAS